MFLVSCRRFAASPTPESLSVVWEERLPGGWQLRVATDPQKVHFSRDTLGFRLETSPWAPEPAPENLRSTTIEWDAQQACLRLRSEPHAGSALYHHLERDGAFLCASHVSHLGDAGVALIENTELLPDYFRYRYVTAPHTLYRDILQLAKSELRVEIRPEGCTPGAARRDPVFPEASAATPSLDEAATRTLEIFEASVDALRDHADHLVVPLSGGMDSSVLFRLAQRRFGERDAWSAGYPFEDPARNRERAYAETAARAFGATHHYHAGSTRDYQRALLRSIAAAEEPLHHLQSPMFELLFRDAVPETRDLVLLGVGAGGVFGSPLQQLVFRNARHPRLWRALAHSPLRPLVARASRASGRGRRFAKRLALPLQEGRVFPQPDSLVAGVDAYGDPAWIEARFGAGLAAQARSRSDLLRDDPGRDLLSQIALIDLFDKTQFLWAKILQSLGRHAHFPFMQADLQRHLLGLPWSLRLGSNKAVLAEVARRIQVPEFILGRAKAGFGVQRDDWAEAGGPLEPLVALAGGAVDEAELRSLQSRDPARAQAFWCLLNLGLWRRLCLAREPLDALLQELDGGAPTQRRGNAARSREARAADA